MIQRIQSIFLLFSGLGFLGQFMTDLATSNGAIPALLADQKYEVQDHAILLSVTVIGALLCLASIFLYTNRPMQGKLSLLSLILAILLPAAAFLLMLNDQGANNGFVINDSIGAYLPLVSIVCSYMAYRYINKDEKLVKSMDRLR